MNIHIFPTREAFDVECCDAEREGATVVPVFAEMVADLETPISVFQRLGAHAPSFLLESAEQNDLIGRYSFVGFGARVIVEGKGAEVRVVENGKPHQFQTSGDPFREFEKIMTRYRAKRHPDLPGFWGGAVGYLAYDAVRWFEPTVQEAPPDVLGIPDLFFMIPELVLIFDHRLRRIRIVAPAFLDGESREMAYSDACQRIARMLMELRAPIETVPMAAETGDELPEVKSNTTQEEYYEFVRKAQEYIRAGDIFQILPSQRFSAEFNGSPLDLYRALRFVNPSPYMFCLRCAENFALVGSSPEIHVRVTQGVVEIRPIAGTRPRGKTSEEDVELAEELLADPKERAEHLMLLDLARNDVGRIAEYGSVEVRDFMTIERYSHVMHIVSHVQGRLAGGRSVFDVVRATFPAGTVSGAPKVRAMQIINEMEKNKRGAYAGAVCYFGFDGYLDSCITLRTIVLKDGVANVQAGGGVVADSSPEGEYQETVNKAKAALRAVALARKLSQK